MTIIDDSSITAPGWTRARVRGVAESIADPRLAATGDGPEPRLVRRELRALAEICVAAAIRADDPDFRGSELAGLDRAATRLAQAGLPVETALGVAHDALRAGFDRPTAATVAAMGHRVMALLNTATITVSGSYVRETTVLDPDAEPATQTAVSALLGGRHGSAAIRHVGVPTAETYTVLTLDLPRTPDASAQSACQRAQRVRKALAEESGGQALTMLSGQGGTVLLPGEYPPDRLERLTAQLTLAAGVEFTAATRQVRAAEVATAVDQLHALLDLVHRLGRGPGLYRMEDMALEYQLTRPGRANRRLRSVLRPLESRPELLETLAAYLTHDGNRKRTARALQLSANALNHRLTNIHRLTGYDPNAAPGLWRLGAAWVAHTAGR